MTATYEKIATTTLGSATASYTFSSISSSYTDLVLVLVGSVSSGSYSVQVGNGSADTGTNYSRTFIYGDGSVAGSGRSTGASSVFFTAGTSSFQTTIINFMNYSNTSTYKTLLARGNDTAASTAAITGLWQSTSAINTVKILGFGGNNLDAGSTFTLYGIKAE
jgi:hypothetical protein